MSELPDTQAASGETADLEALKTRIHVYESFDSVIAENTAKAKAILIEAAELRERVAREIAEEREALRAEIADRRMRLDAEFVGLRAAFDAELASRRQRFEDEYAGRRAELESELTRISQLITNEQQRYAAARSSLAAIARAILAMTPEGETAEAIAPPEPEPAPVAASPVSETAPAESAIEADTPPAAVSESAEPEDAPPAPAAAPEPVKTTIIVHGIFRPMVATGLQRFLLAKDGVVSVEPREFAEGILRLQIRSALPITGELFSGWGDGNDMEIVQRGAQTIELILPTAG